MDSDLFTKEQPDTDNTAAQGKAPLADRIRPAKLDQIIGQKHLVGNNNFLREAIASDEIPSMILWGPPGIGKTTIARIIANETNYFFVSLSAVLSGVKDVKKVVEMARFQMKGHQKRTILFVDEIHRFNKAQQDAFLPHVEDGTLVLIGATTENPSFSVIAPLLSRSRVLVLNPLSDEEITELLNRALTDSENGLGKLKISTEEGSLGLISLYANGDARAALNAIEVAANLARRRNPYKTILDKDVVKQALQQRTLLYDKNGEEHYNLISALHKSIRNSDPDASLYWLTRMLESGEDPKYVARRLIRFASEDVGLSDPRALGFAVDALRAYDFLGMPEGDLALAQVVIYLAVVPKSNAVYMASKAVKKDVAETRHQPVPLHLRNAPTGLMKELDYGKGYQYAHDSEEGVTDMLCLPDNLLDRVYYEPSDRGQEKSIRMKLEEIRKTRGIKHKKQK
jgi:putative ATPase